MMYSKMFDVETFALPSRYQLQPLRGPTFPTITDRYLKVSHRNGEMTVHNGYGL